VATLFHLARERPANERADYLDAACAGDPELRRRLEIILDADDRPGDFLARPVVNLGAPPDQQKVGSCDKDGSGASPESASDPHLIAEGPGSRVGPYKLLQPIGEGGMGVVYVAEQEHPVHRLVALKIIKPGIDSRQVISRFEAERQALALMDHPSIAKVLDAATTGSGQPYFVMELVRGVPVTDYCDQHRLTPRQRLELFVPICEAVQHAHQKGIIHRDLKPTNILIARYDDHPVPMLIDFGVAKATGGKLTERTLFTEFGSVVGTPEYMSPEQAELHLLGVTLRQRLSHGRPHARWPAQNHGG
jgi:serine/threonine protein kinase